MTGHVLPRRGSQVTRARLHRSGADTVRVLLVGDRGQLLDGGDGASVAQRTVDRVWLSTRCGVDLDVLADLAPVLDRVTAAFDEWRLWRFDVVVLALGARLTDRHRVRALQRVHDLLLADEAHRMPLVLISTGTSGHRGRTEEEQVLLRRLRHTGAERLRVAEVPPTAGRDERARAWATAISTQVVEVLTVRSGPVLHEQQDEGSRQAALDELGVVGRPPEPRLDDLVRLACTAFDAEGAEINFIDHDRQWRMARAHADGGVDSAAERGEDSRAQSFCTHTIMRPEPLVVGDARLDPVLRTSPLVRGPHPVRFYAAHPIESLDGYRIGSFCVYDSEPRDVRELDLAVLRDLALLAQAELIAQDVPPAEAAERLRAHR